MSLPRRFGDVAGLDPELDVSPVFSLDPDLVTPGGERTEERGPDHRRAEMAFAHRGVRAVPRRAHGPNLDLESRELLRHVQHCRAPVAADVGHHTRGRARAERGLTLVVMGHQLTS